MRNKVQNYYLHSSLVLYFMLILIMSNVIVLVSRIIHSPYKLPSGVFLDRKLNVFRSSLKHKRYIKICVVYT